MKKASLIMFSIVIFILVGCANEDGNKQKCPKCDNKTQLLVGNKCVNISEIEECGPDGHSHGASEPCHCFSGQEQTEINGKRYCLQNACVDMSECSGHGHLEGEECHCNHGYEKGKASNTCVKAEEEDIDKHACEASLENEIHTATDSFNGAHIELEKKLKINLLAGTSYVHFPMTEDQEFALYVNKTGLFVDAHSKDGAVKFEKEEKGANEDCESDFPEVFHIDAKKQDAKAAKEPVVLEFNSKEATEVIIFIHPVSHHHEDHEHE